MANKLRSLVELMRLHKPTGTILTLTPSLWTVGLVTSEACLIPDPKVCAIFTAGAIVARGMGCTVNDLLDRKYDRLVERTKSRPLASGALSLKEGLVSLGVQSSVGLYVLCLNNPSVIKLGLFSGLMISTYPLFKRFTYWPQAMLALTINWGVPMGYAAIKGTIEVSDLPILLPIYLGSICWTLFYDTVYAHQDKVDDSFIGVKSTALMLGTNTKNFLYQMSGCMYLSLTTAGLLTGQLWPYYLSLLFTSMFQMNMIRTVNLDNPSLCWNVFDQQKYIGLLILVGVLASTAIKHKNREQVQINRVE